MSKLLVLSLLLLTLVTPAWASTNTLIFAVGHDHDKMASLDYPMYNAKWEFINESLALLGYRVEVMQLPWARAKYLTQTGKAHGLFLAANLPGREKWASLSNKLGYGVFGSFSHKENPNKRDIIASIRLGMHDRILADVPVEDLLMVATAQEGFKLLYNKKVDMFIMSESYGRYLLNTELQDYQHKLSFNPDNIEKRTTHIAFSKEHSDSQAALKIVNEAIALGLEQGLYEKAMDRNRVPERMRLKLTP